MAAWRRSGSPFGDFPPYVSAAERRKKAARAVAALTKKGQKVSPVQIQGRKLATTFWGKAWCDNLERYSDFESRLPRGRTYVRSGAVIDLQISKGRVTALVQGSDLYEVSIDIQQVDAARWEAMIAECTGKIDSVVELLSGRLSGAVMAIMTRKETGLFPAPAEIKMRCSCPDRAGMCKHIAAVLYGIGARLDSSPELLFDLRGKSPSDLVTHAGATGLLHAGKPRSKDELLDTSDLGSLFGIEMADSPPAAVAGAAKRVSKSPPQRTAAGAGAAKRVSKSPPRPPAQPRSGAASAPPAHARRLSARKAGNA